MSLGEIILICFSKYFILAGISYLIFYKWFPNNFAHLRIQKTPRPSSPIKNEIFFSTMSLLIQGLMIYALAVGANQGIFSISWGWFSIPWYQSLISFLVFFLIYDPYFYFSHAILHQPWLYKHVHKVHHLSLNPNPFSSYSFHPIEAFVSLLYIYPVMFLLPMSWELFWTIMVLSDIGNIGGHLGFELLPKSVVNSRVGHWITTPTHHNLHHQVPSSNFGLYWNGWDKLFKTMNKKIYQRGTG